MPIYEFVCMTCESHFEELFRLDDPDPACPDCGDEKVARQLSVFAAHGTAEQPSFGGTCWRRLLRRRLWLRLTWRP